MCVAGAPSVSRRLLAKARSRSRRYIRSSLSDYRELHLLITRDLVAEINELRTQRRAAILAHNYQRPEIQDIADVVADSLAMARRATELDAPILVICGVHFMAETAAIANPDKRILIPDPTAGCSLASTIQAADVRAWRATHPEGLVVAYINTAAAVKAEPDYPCPTLRGGHGSRRAASVAARESRKGIHRGPRVGRMSVHEADHAGERARRGPRPEIRRDGRARHRVSRATR